MRDVLDAGVQSMILFRMFTGAAHLWLAVQTYITYIAKEYAIITHTKAQDRLHLFIGIFYAFTYASK